MTKSMEYCPREAENYDGHIQQLAPQEAVDYVLKQPVETGEGRSKWMWIRLPNGDLVLAIYPQGDTYFSTEHWRTT